jgi:hypothetical protein
LENVTPNRNQPEEESGKGRNEGYCTSLDAWSELPWRDGVQVDRLAALDTFSFQTKNSIYEVTVLCAETGEVLVRGGEFFPKLKPALLVGSTLGGSFLKLRGVFPGFNIEFATAEQRITTTRVQFIDLRQPALN